MGKTGWESEGEKRQARIYFKDGSKVLLYFSNMRYNLAAADSFVEFVEVTNQTEQ